MTLIQLEYIIAVDKYRHFVSAADACHVTQPTLSMQIKKLEDELNVIIFDRNKQPIEPSSIGKKIIDQARTILQGKDRINELISDTRNDLSGDVRIGVIPTIASYLVPLFLPKLVKKYPDINVYVEELMTHEVIEQMRHGFLDIGIVSTPLEEDSIKEIPVYYEPFELFISANHKLAEKKTISSRDLKLDDMWLLSDGHCFRNHVINLCGEQNYYPKNLEFGYKTGSLEVLMKFVEQNYGYTLLPHLATLNINDERKKLIRSFKEPTPKREVSIIVPEGYLKEKLQNAIFNEIRQNIPKEMRYLDNGKVINWKK